jgi:transposase
MDIIFCAGKSNWMKHKFGGKRKGKHGRGATHKVPVSSILECDGEFFVKTVPNIKAETVLELTIKKVQRGSLFYTNCYRIYDTLMFCGYRPLSVDRQYHFAAVCISMAGKASGVTPKSDFKNITVFHHNTSRLTSKNLDFRFNHRLQDIFPILVDFITDFGPNIE